ncbi:MAG: hypothetical protein WB507_14305 [Solirubrobacterales bacterium]
MRLHRQFRECVAFLRTRTDAANIKPVATAFFVHVPITGNRAAVYLVTAAHVVQKARARSKSLFVRVNQTDIWEDLEIPDLAWHEHGESDVAIAEIQLPEDFRGKTIPLEILATDDQCQKYDIGEGDDVFMSSLFTEFTGRERDQPIVRFGSVALGRHEPLAVTMPHAETTMEAYLVEVRSWGGQSGSPVFVSFMGSSGYAEKRDRPVRAKLLGLMHGHYEIPAKVNFNPSTSSTAPEIITETASAETKATAPVNAGIGVVMPAQKIIDLLMEDELVAKRDEEKKRLEDDEPTPVPDSLEDDEPSGFERFEDLTDKLLGVPKKKLDEKLKEDKD